jgi:hypothetical protein
LSGLGLPRSIFSAVVRTLEVDDIAFEFALLNGSDDL